MAKQAGDSRTTGETRYWIRSNYTIKELVQQCESRNISVPKGSKKQVYLDLIEAHLVQDNSSKAPRVWNKLTVKDLKEECKLRDIDVTGLKKQDLVNKLGAAVAKHVDDNATKSKKAGSPASKDNQKVGDSSKDAVNKYKGWKYKRLFKEWKSLEIPRPSKKKEDIVAALIARDLKKASQGAGKSGKPPGGDAGGDQGGSGDDQGGSGGGQGDSGDGQNGSGHGQGRDPSLSPTTSAGPKFDPAPTTPAAALFCARLESSDREGKGFRNPRVFCYRNASIVLLLNSNRIMSWIDIRYIPYLKAKGLHIQTYKTSLGPNGRKQEDRDRRKIAGQKSTSMAYTDVWCELSALREVYWADPQPTRAVLNAAMDTFWEYLINPQRKIEASKLLEGNDFFVEFAGLQQPRSRPSQQCASDFLSWLLNLSIDQVARALRDLGDINDPVDINEMVMSAQTNRYSCVQCGPERTAKNHVKRLDEHRILSLSLPVSSTNPDESTRNRATVTLDELLQLFCKSHGQGGRCEKCNIVWGLEKDARRWLAQRAGAEQAAEVEKDIQFKAGKMNERPSVSWKRFCTAPEVLLMSFTYFAGGTVNKQDVHVELEDTLDLTPYLEKDVPGLRSAKYQLVGIVNHSGSSRREVTTSLRSAGVTLGTRSMMTTSHHQQTWLESTMKRAGSRKGEICRGPTIDGRLIWCCIERIVEEQKEEEAA